MSKETNLKGLTVITVILLVFCCTIAAGDAIYVDANIPDGNGTSRADAYQSLQDALVEANFLRPPFDMLRGF
jgi:hypothetical protein